MTEYMINTVEGALEELNTLVSHYKHERDKKDEKGEEKMSISYQGSVLGLLMLKAQITGEELEKTEWWLL